jgi:hypothetical protein
MEIWFATRKIFVDYYTPNKRKSRLISGIFIYLQFIAINNNLASFQHGGFAGGRQQCY